MVTKCCSFGSKLPWVILDRPPQALHTWIRAIYPFAPGRSSQDPSYWMKSIWATILRTVYSCYGMWETHRCWLSSVPQVMVLCLRSCSSLRVTCTLWADFLQGLLCYWLQNKEDAPGRSLKQHKDSVFLFVWFENGKEKVNPWEK